MYPGIAPVRELKPRRLKGMRTYLAGAMDRVPDGGIGWRRKITPRLRELDVVVLDPCEKAYLGLPENPNIRQELDESRRTGDFENVELYMSDVAAIDLRMVDVSDFIILSLDVNVHMCGSYDEFSRANGQLKPILVWAQHGKKEVPNWMFGRIPHDHIFDSLDDVMQYLNHVNTANFIHRYGRWWFPDFEALYGQFIPPVLDLTLHDHRDSTTANHP